MLKKLSRIFLTCVLLMTSTYTTSCHNCVFDKKILQDEYLAISATCQTPAEYYYSCECGRTGEETFKSGIFSLCKYTQEVVSDEYLKTEATCTTPAVYYKSCEICGKRGPHFQTFKYGECGDCKEFSEIVNGKFLYLEATKTESAVYYKSCPLCGMIGTETFSYGQPLKTYTDEEKIPYTPISLTVSLYDSENSIYGFTCNTEKEPLRPVLQVAKGTTLHNYKEYAVQVEKCFSYDANNLTMTYYVLKAEALLEGNEVYTYRIYDKYVETGTPTVTIQTKNVKATNFSFVHVSDTQEYPNAFANVLKSVSVNTDFLLHTGDIVESSKYEHEWKAMLNGNFQYLSQLPMMAIAGNHETTYKNGSNETYKHFNNKIPEQTSTSLGYFYSFTYGNAKFIMLNTNELSGNRLNSEQYNWLVNELQNNKETWTIVSMHNPMYSVGKYGMDPARNQPALGLQAQLQGLFAQYRVDIVLQGHDHTVSRTYPINGKGEPQKESTQVINGVEYSINPNGVLYLMNGTSGGQTRGPHALDNKFYKYAQASNASSWAEFTIEGNMMTVSVNYYTENGIQTYQSWGIKKN